MIREGTTTKFNSSTSWTAFVELQLTKLAIIDNKETCELQVLTSLFKMLPPRIFIQTINVFE